MCFLFVRLKELNGDFDEVVFGKFDGIVDKVD